jgi:homogentisate 1,2-dioxygenase
VIERRAAGELPKKHHTVLRSPEGQLRHEECLTRDGFEGPYTILYHLERPHAQRVVELPHGWIVPMADRADTTLPLRRRHYLSQKLPSQTGATQKPALDARIPLLFNHDVTLSILRPSVVDPVYFANGDGDDLYYIHEGGGLLRSIVGDLPFSTGDYVYVPRGLLHRFLPDGSPQFWLSIEARGGIGLPKQWRNEVGQLRMDAPYCHRDFRLPEFKGPVDEQIRDVLVKRGGDFHGFSHAHSPLDVVGWDGTVYPWAFPILYFQPRVGLVHLPPTWHGTFAARGALICSFVPRVVDFHPEAVPCPYPHASVDCDEFIFYCKGNFTSRRGVGPGSISHHPAGIPHGPHPGAYESSLGSTRTDELAVMLDTFLPLVPTPAARSIEDPQYHDSFLD